MTKHNGTRYSPERKAEMINRMTAPTNESVADISKEESISTVTLYKWRKEARVAGIATQVTSGIAKISF